ncbi:hypothetical protein LGT40_10415 [Methylophaga sp. TMB456]|nr:hypothetical protein [Methylophaga pinxianii]
MPEFGRMNIWSVQGQLPSQVIKHNNNLLAEEVNCAAIKQYNNRIFQRTFGMMSRYFSSIFRCLVAQLLGDKND